MVETKTFLLDRRNSLFLKGIADPSVRPEFARLLGTPRGALRLFVAGHPIRGTITIASGILQFFFFGLFGCGIFCFLVCLSGFMAGMFLAIVEAGRRAAGFGQSSEDLCIPIFVVGWAVALVFNMRWGTAEFRRSLPAIVAGLRLARSGTVLSGQIVSCKSSSQLHHNGWHDEVLASFAMSYSFVTPAGKKLSGWVCELPVNPTKRWNPAPGDPISILYADDDNFQVL